MIPQQGARYPCGMQAASIFDTSGDVYQQYRGQGYI